MRVPGEEATLSELVSAAQARDPEAWTALVTRYGGMVHAVAAQFRLQDADIADAAASTWLRAVEQIDTLRQPERFGGWLKTIVYRECLGVLTLARREYLDPHVAEHVAEPTPGPEAQVLRAEVRHAVRGALDTLPTRRRVLMEVLFYRSVLDYAHVARAVDMPLGSVGPTRARALRGLRAHLERDGFAPASSAA